MLNCSNFSDVFDVEHFISALANDVKVIKKLPKELATTTKAVKHFRSWSGVDYYRDEISRLWDDYEVWHLFTIRLMELILFTDAWLIYLIFSLDYSSG